MRIVRRTSRGNILRLVEADFPQDEAHGADAMGCVINAGSWCEVKVTRRPARGNVFRVVEAAEPAGVARGDAAMDRIIFAMRGFGFEIGRRAVEREIRALLECNVGRHE